MADMIHGRPSSMQAYRPEGPNQVQAVGPVQGMMAQEVNFVAQDATGEENLVRYLTESRAGVETYHATVNTTGGEYVATDVFNGAQYTRSIDTTEA